MHTRARAQKPKSTRGPLAEVGARELWRDTGQLFKRRGAQLVLAVLPFGVASIGFEQSILKCYPRCIADLRVVSMASFYVSVLLGYFAVAAVSTIAVPYFGAASRPPPKFVGFRWRQLGAIAAIAGLAPLCTLAGLAVAIVPGIIVWLGWVASVPAATMDGLGPLEAMRQSMRVTWGSRWSLFYVFAVIQCCALVLPLIIAMATGQSLGSVFQEPKPLSLGEALSATLMETAQIALSASICCATFVRLKPVRGHQETTP